MASRLITATMGDIGLYLFTFSILILRFRHNYRATGVIDELLCARRLSTEGGGLHSSTGVMFRHKRYGTAESWRNAA